MLRAWHADEYSSEEGFDLSIDFGQKSTIYNSDLALKGNIFNVNDWLGDYPSKYHLYNFNTKFEEGDGVPGGFQYDRPIEQWRKDQKYNMGPSKYATIIGGFGHNHILTVQAAIELKRVGHVNIGHEMMLERLTEGSTQIFKWYAGLVDDKGVLIPFDPKTLPGMLKQLMLQLIESEEVIDLDRLYDNFTAFNVKFFKNDKELTAIINQTKKANNEILRNGNIPFLSWHRGMKHHQHHTLHLYDDYYHYYHSDSNEEFRRAKAKLNVAVRDLIDSGPQLGAFFQTFYGAVVFLDRALDIIGAKSEPCIPPKLRMDRLKCLGTLSHSYWMQHTALFADFDMVSANPYIKDPEIEMYRIKVTMLESCEEIAIFLGELFSSFDWLIRGRKLLDQL